MGFVPVSDFEIASVIRYRDGQPMTRYLIANLDQGPTPLMAVARGEPVPRHTFHMTWDVRMTYAFEMAGANVGVGLDIYNLLGSSTEILEQFNRGAVQTFTGDGSKPCTKFFGQLELVRLSSERRDEGRGRCESTDGAEESASE